MHIEVKFTLNPAGGACVGFDVEEASGRGSLRLAACPDIPEKIRVLSEVSRGMQTYLEELEKDVDALPSASFRIVNIEMSEPSERILRMVGIFAAKDYHRLCLAESKNGEPNKRTTDNSGASPLRA